MKFISIVSFCIFAHSAPALSNSAPALSNPDQMSSHANEAKKSSSRISCPPGYVAVYDVGYKRWTCVLASCGGGNYDNCGGE